MSNDRRQRRMLKRRAQMVAEQLMENSSLRDNLEDEQATLLLNWGLAQVKASAKKTAVLPEEDAQPIMEKTGTAVRLIMHGINDLVGGVGQPLEFDIIDDTMTRVLKNLRWLTNEKPTTVQLQAVVEFNHAREAEDKDAAFTHLMTLLIPEESEDKENI